MVSSTLLLAFATIGLLSTSVFGKQFNISDAAVDYYDACSEYGSSDVTCVEYNSTFEHMKPNTTLSSYSGAVWTGFQVAKHNRRDPILAASKPHTARSTSGFGVLDYSDSPGGIGLLSRFNWACADSTAVKANAVNCAMNVTATCATSEEGVLFSYSGYFNYEPASAQGAAMTVGDFQNVANDYADSGLAFFCVNYTFEAVVTGGDVQLAVLYLDNVISNTWDFYDAK